MIHEQIASDPKHVVRDVWRLAAPDRAAYEITGGSVAVMIGSRRWDRKPGGRWQASEQSPLSEPAPPWGTAPARAWLLGSAHVDGRPVWVVAFVDPGVPAWVRLWIDKTNLRTLELSLTAAAHFMHHRYSDFNRAAPIGPPASAR